MNTRRVLLFVGAGVASLSALPAWAKRRHAPEAGATPSGDEGGPGASTAVVSSPAETPIGPVDTVATHAIVIDFNTGAVLLTKDPDTPSPPSSLTKLMTIYITFQQLKEGKLRLGQTFLISEHAWHMGGSRMFVQVGTNVTIEDLIRGIFVDSGNDAAVALAEGIGGTEDNFATMMNAAAAKLGMTHSHFLNASGWPADGHFMSVRDIATLSEHIIRDFPEYYHYAGEQSFAYNKINQMNRNPLVTAGLGDGLKTGHTEEGGYSLAGTTERNYRRVIVVLNGLPSWDSRVTESKRLMDWAFNSFQDVQLFAAGAQVTQAPVWLGEAPMVGLTVPQPAVVTMPMGWQNTVKVAVDYPAPIPAPITAGQVIGQINVTGPGIPSGQAATGAQLVAMTDVRRLGLPGRALARLRHFITGA
ncbi:D-alanyl-D-alanine carboxypeptidase family protein [Acidisoma sp.]|uniref:D-alanyl-D-alanine carboxypeptidase family protein n=1 Tax=Acidisoma sp. TaxID=1872115 RepID=UPI003B00024A